jgi:endonuclease-3
MKMLELSAMALAAHVDRLQKFYGALSAPPRDPFTLFVWEVLSTHSTPRKRDAAMASLKRARALTPDAMWRAPQKKLEESVAIAGPYLEQRLKALRSGVDAFRRTPALPSIIRGPLTAARRALKGLPQMGEGGAYRMLLFAADHPVLPVDARVTRVVKRLGLIDASTQKDFAKTARAVRDAVAAALPAETDAYRRAFLYLNHHGAATCTEADPHCSVCPLRSDCPDGRQRLEHSEGRLRI